MEIYSLVIAHMRAAARTVPMSALAEDCYYAKHSDMRCFRPGVPGSVAMAAGMIVMLGLALG
ncbi:hypothetical protein [Pararhizobium antarcticum]|uniref:Uncharacterized protein n=1 Tax=Pararhizobium antarcticum TaxID=1798805 RepID=A0A657LZ01_9HYPH|nr:hypothetical protein [Pararhizobium antarcticum]OJF90332.1 hypothetical protein AX761_06580 [Rhizobium sp. 58]OJG00606.1 hypothetical protein AX760_10610 [Pararhizobium antarcticum]